MATEVLIDASGQTGIYYDHNGYPMLSSRSRAIRLHKSRRRRDARFAIGDSDTSSSQNQLLVREILTATVVPSPANR